MARKNKIDSNIERLNKLAENSMGESRRLLEEAAKNLEEARRLSEENEKRLRKYLSQTPQQRGSQRIVNDMERLIREHNIPKSQICKFSPHIYNSGFWRVPYN